MSNIKKFYHKITENLKKRGDFYKDSQGKNYSYEEFYIKILKGNSTLHKFKNKKIVVLADKNINSYASIMSIILSGNIWIPLSNETPIERNIEIINDLNPHIIITDIQFKENDKNKIKKKNIKFLNINLFVNGSVANPTLNYSLDKERTVIIYFTSGSTGKPKGVKISNLGLSDAICRITPLLKVKPGFIWGDFHDLSFVISINIILKCLFSKGKIYCGFSKLDQLVPNNSIISNDINCLVTVPSTLLRMSNDKNFVNIFKSLRTVVSCGEPFPLDLMKSYITANKKLNLFNFYGSTELTTWIFYHKCTKKDLQKFKSYGYVPIGKGIEGNRVSVLKNNLLIVNSSQVTPGYLNKNRMSHFLMHEGENWFSTGDVVEKINETFICKGRLDNQVKLHGYRIQLMDIETKIKKIEGVIDCMCFMSKEKNTDLISAIIISKLKFTLNDVRGHLLKKLPNYMVPRKVYCLKNKPTNKNGKLDRSKLRTMFINT